MIRKCLYIVLCVLPAMTSCRKVKYNSVSNPAYIRVFNSLNYAITLSNKDNPPPFLTMVIDPVFDASGVVTGGAVTGDYLDKRLPYAPPYPSNAGSTSTVNNEYPGNTKVLVGSVVNGFDLSGWAQVTSGKHRIQFYNRTVSTVPFFQLPAEARKYLLVDTTLTLTPGEVYTMEVLQKDIYRTTDIAFLYVRNEQFTKMAWADSLSYVNFYNLSAAGYGNTYYDKDPGGSQGNNSGHVIRDTLNIFYSLFTPDSTDANSVGKNPVPGYQGLPLTSLVRSFQPSVATYYPIPLFAGKDTTGGIYSHLWQRLTFLLPAYAPLTRPFTDYTGNTQYGYYATLDCTEAYPNTVGGMNAVPNLNVLTPSGPYPERSFSAISSIEWINNRVYMISVQRQYPAPYNN